MMILEEGFYYVPITIVCRVQSSEWERVRESTFKKHPELLKVVRARTRSGSERVQLKDYVTKHIFVGNGAEQN